MELKIGNFTCSELAKKYGTPLYVYDEALMRHIIRLYKNNLVSDKFDTLVLFASKAFACMAMYKLVHEEGIGSDVVSGGELYAALKYQDPDKIYFHGNNKTMAEIEMGINAGVNFVCDNLGEAMMLEEASNRLKKNVNVLFRLNVGVEAHTHKFIVTAHVDSKFGMLISSDDLKKSIDIVEKSQYLNLAGFHSHIGSQIFDPSGFYAAIDKIIEFLKGFDKKLILNIGGGYGVRYTDEDKPIPYDEISKMLIKHTEEALEKNNVSIKALVIEPGRSIVGEAGYTLYTVGNTKKTPNRQYYFIDGGMADNIRPALYQAKYDAVIANKMDAPKTEVVTLAGKCCESGDLIIEDIKMAKAERGDIVCVFTTGAYGYSMSSHYNKAQTPAVVFVNGDKDRLVIKRESYEDLYRNDCE